MNNIVSKNITTLPSDICDIIYEYYKLPFLDDIKNPFNKYCLCKSYMRDIGYKGWKNREYTPTKRFNRDTYHLNFDNDRYSIVPQLLNEIRTSDRGWYVYEWYNFKHKPYREFLIKRCKENRIELKPREHTKTLIKKLMKL